jgi:N-alpha-acetyl-L-2,4-diaminobutyrate deacetylase
MLDTAVEDKGRVFLFTELGGGGTAIPGTVAIAERGIQNLLKHLGMIAGEPEHTETRLMHSPDASYFTVSDDHGILEMLLDLDAEVAEGQVIAQIHHIEKPGTEPVRYRARQSGLLIGRHHPGLIQPGDCLAVIATEYSGIV